MVVSYSSFVTPPTMRVNNKKHMSLKANSAKGGKSKGNGKKNSNITGYQKRIAQKPPKASTLLDIYEFDDKQRKGRTRADVTLDLSREEAREYGVEEQSEEDDLERMRQKLRIGEDGVANSEDDEDIDSDDAFDQSDEERFGEHNFQSNEKITKASPKKNLPTEVDLDEDEDMDDSSEGAEIGEVPSVVETDEEMENGHGNEGKSDEEDSDGANGDSQEALQALGKYIDSLEYASSTKKRKPSDIKDDLPQPPQQRRRILKEQTQPGTEGEFASFRHSKNKLQFSDLIAPLAAEGASSSAAALTAAAKALNSAKAAPLSAPLPLRTQARLDRQAAYEQTKEEVQRWEPTMKRIREAEHLSFPLQAQSIPPPNIAELASNFKPETNLESAVDRLLKAAELRDQDIAKVEELQMQHLTEEDIATRRAELRKMRDLMFRAEIKAKRISKIKSKTYRKIQKRERTKQAEKLKEMGLGVDDETERMKMEVDRAKERATLKHKNNGKWAASIRARRELDEDQRKDMQEMYERGERLKKKIAAVDSDEESSEESEEGDGDARLDELAALARDDPQTASLSGRQSGLMQMKFMKDAERRDQASNRDAIDSFNDELNKLGLRQGSDEDEITPDKMTAVSRFGGRVSFEPGETRNQVPSSADASPHMRRREDEATLDKENPWLKLASTSTNKLSRAKNEVLVGKNSNSAALSKNALKKRMRKGVDAVAQAKDDSILEIDVNSIIHVKKAKDKTTRQPVKQPYKTQNSNKLQAAGLRVLEPNLGTDEDTEDEPVINETATNGRKTLLTAFEQSDLVARAFAGDHVVKEFQTEKGREMETDGPKEVDTTLPGWGSWGGAGITKAPPKPERIKRFPGIDPKSRQDYGKDHVIISEKKDKKAQKYLVKDLPFPYTSKAQFERRMETPLGMEWNTRSTFQKATLPRVVKKMGTVIEPLERLF